MKTPTQKTYSAKPTDVVRAWHLVDASEASFGRVATEVATLLTGKQKPQFTQHIDCGDFVVVINADKLVYTGNKLIGKKYYRHSNYPGGIKEATLKDKLEQNPTSVIEHAVRGMLPVNKLRAGRLARLKVYASSEHEHAAQKPVVYKLNKETK